MRGIPNTQHTMKKPEAEKFFGRKSSPDSNLGTKEFLNKKVVTPVKNYGKNVVGGAKIVGRKVVDTLAAPLVKEFKMQEEADKINKEKGKKLNQEYSGRVKGRSTSTGYMPR